MYIKYFSDSPGHKSRDGTDWEKDTFLDVMQNVTELFKSYLTDGTPFLPVMGNHDYFPKNQVGLTMLSIPWIPLDTIYH